VQAGKSEAQGASDKRACACAPVRQCKRARAQTTRATALPRPQRHAAHIHREKWYIMLYGGIWKAERIAVKKEGGGGCQSIRWRKVVETASSQKCYVGWRLLVRGICRLAGCRCGRLAAQRRHKAASAGQQLAKVG